MVRKCRRRLSSSQSFHSLLLELKRGRQDFRKPWSRKDLRAGAAQQDYLTLRTRGGVKSRVPQSLFADYFFVPNRATPKDPQQETNAKEVKENAYQVTWSLI